MAGKLERKIALVTGGSSGIGLATAQRFAKEGAFVFITGRRETELEKAVASIGADKAKAIRADASNLADLDRLYEEIKKNKGRLDVLFVNAGGGSFAPLGSITEEHYDQTFNTNVKGVLFTVQKALPLIPNGGAIVLNASQVLECSLATQQNVTCYYAKREREKLMALINKGAASLSVKLPGELPHRVTEERHLFAPSIASRTDVRFEAVPPRTKEQITVPAYTAVLLAWR
ncbi:MAG: SDR family NAD(P)-dependent oxidoreductase [Terracidiphilus sp.]